MGEEYYWSLSKFKNEFNVFENEISRLCSKLNDFVLIEVTPDQNGELLRSVFYSITLKRQDDEVHVYVMECHPFVKDQMFEKYFRTFDLSKFWSFNIEELHQELYELMAGN